ncbi:MAG: flavodoxin family protein [bacterium]
MSEQGDNRLVCILGSPRRDGNSDTLAKSFILGASQIGIESEFIIPSEIGISWCTGDNQCFKDGKCIIRDGMHDIYELVINSRWLLIASPVYFMGPPAPLKAFIDRFQAIWARARILKNFDPDDPKRRDSHIAYLILVASHSDPKMVKPALSIIKAFINVIGFSYAGELIATGLESKQDALRNGDLMERAYSLGRNLISAKQT